MATYYHPGYLINTIDTGLYVPVEEITRSLHRPCVFMFTQSGPYNKPVWVNDILEAKSIFGEETFNKSNSDYYSRESRLVETFLPHHGCYITRLLPTDDFQVGGEQPESARVILTLDITESTLTNYQRNLDGSFVLDGSGNKVVIPYNPSIEGYEFFFHYKYVSDEDWTTKTTQELLTKMTTTPGTTSYNIMLINDSYPGKDGNRFGFNFYRDIEAYDSNFIDEIKAMMYTFKPKKKVYNNVQVTPMLDKYNSVFNNFSLKENTIDPNTNIELSIDKVLDNKYDNFNYEFIVNTELIKEIGNLYLDKRQVIDGAETPGYIDSGILIDEPFMIDFINFKDFNGNPLIGTEKEAIEDRPGLNPITKDTIIYLDGGKDGNKTDSTKEFLISEFCKATLFPDILNKAKYPITHIYDMGYTIATKKKMLDFMAIRDDVSVTAVTQVFSSGTKVEEEEEEEDIRPEIPPEIILTNQMIDAGEFHTVGLKSDGTCVATGDNYEGQCNVDSWTNIVKVACGYEYTIGLKSDGTCVATGDNYHEQCNVSSWTNIIQVACGSEYTIGLKSDGTCVAVGHNNDGQCNVSSWTDIIQVACGAHHTVGLKSDDTCVVVGRNENGQCNVSSWTNIVQVTGGGFHTVGLKSDGTCVAVGDNQNEQCNVSTWTNIVQVTGGAFHTVGVKEDGTCVATGYNYYDPCNVDSWTNIVQVAGGYNFTIGLKEDGTCVAIGRNENDQGNVGSWDLF